MCRLASFHGYYRNPICRDVICTTTTRNGANRPRFVGGSCSTTAQQHRLCSCDLLHLSSKRAGKRRHYCNIGGLLVFGSNHEEITNYAGRWVCGRNNLLSIRKFCAYISLVFEHQQNSLHFSCKPRRRKSGRCWDFH